MRRMQRHATNARLAFSTYRETLPPERRVLVDRYTLSDIAFKVVGVGSVGTFCAIGLFATADAEPLFLQVKEAQTSVLERIDGPTTPIVHQGRRVVEGQRVMQAASDIFLGWTEDHKAGRFLYVRHLKNRRLGSIGEVIEGNALAAYATLCGRTLARAHARSGDAALLAGYMGKSDVLDDALANFAMAYAEQTKRDHGRLAAWLAEAKRQNAEDQKLTRRRTERSGRFARPTQLGLPSEGRAFHHSTRTPGRNRLSGMDQITERRTPRDVASETYHEFRDLAIVAPSMAGNGYARAGPCAEGVVERRANGFGRQALADVVSKQSRYIGRIHRLSQPGGAGEIAFSVATEAGTVHDPFVPLQLRLYAGHYCRQSIKRVRAHIGFWQIVPVVIAVDLPEIGRHVAILRSARLRPQPVQTHVGSGKTG